MSQLVAQDVRVDRYRRPAVVAGVIVAAGYLVLATAPYYLDVSVTSSWIKLFYLVTLATTWNLLAGYAGMLSVGQQAYIGLGAYGVFVFNDIGLDPYSAAVVAAVIVGVIAFGLSFIAFRLRGGYFAIGTWVIAEVVRQIVTRFSYVGAGRGFGLQDYVRDPTARNFYNYQLALAVAAVVLAATFYMLRSRTGVALQSIRDNEVAAQSLGINVSRSKRIVFVMAAVGASLAGSVICLQALGVQNPNAIFSVNFSAFMIFMVLIGGIGTIEGPVIGAGIYFLMDDYFSQTGVWYLVILGLLAILVTLFLPRGIWGELAARFNLRLFPVGHRIVPLASRK